MKPLTLTTNIWMTCSRGWKSGVKCDAIAKNQYFWIGCTDCHNKCCFPLAEKRTKQQTYRLTEDWVPVNRGNGHRVGRVFSFSCLPSMWPAHPPILEGTEDVLIVLCKVINFFLLQNIYRYYYGMVSADSWWISDSLSQVVALCSFVNIGKSSFHSGHAVRLTYRSGVWENVFSLPQYTEHKLCPSEFTPTFGM